MNDKITQFTTDIKEQLIKMNTESLPYQYEYNALSHMLSYMTGHFHNSDTYYDAYYLAQIEYIAVLLSANIDREDMVLKLIGLISLDLFSIVQNPDSCELYILSARSTLKKLEESLSTIK